LLSVARIPARGGEQDMLARPEVTGRNSFEGRLLVTVPEAMQAIGVGRTTLYELIAAAELELVKIGSASRVPVASIEAYVDRLRARRASEKAT
jgi:excisionase family DNA binding protein